MALTQCLDCGKDVSTFAISCPNCGRPLDSQQKERIACPDGRCTGTIGEEEGTCGTCGKTTNWKDDEEETCVGTPDNPAGANSAESLRFVLGGLGIFIIFAWICLFYLGGKSDPPPPKIRTAEDTQTMAAIQCQGFVKASLKSPATADFPWTDYTATPLGDGTYSVRSYVDAQNSFGATIRSDYTCVVKYLGGDDAYIGNWQLINMQIK
jgi:hypothetical protein